MPHWSENEIPDRTGALVVVTGANTGIGYETARALVARGAHVILACRAEERGVPAAERIQALGLPGRAEYRHLDLARLQSVRDFAGALRADFARLDTLILNAGVMMPPLSHTEDGFELQIGVNFLGHFVLTAELSDWLERSDAPRVVALSSLAHRRARVDLESFRQPKKYDPWRAYQQSKIACLMFAIELEERARAAGRRVVANAAHPGATKTELQRYSRLFDLGARAFGMRAARGALPTLYAATAPEALGGAYYGPRGVYELWGSPAPAWIDPRARDRALRAALWDKAEELCARPFGLGPVPASEAS